MNYLGLCRLSNVIHQARNISTYLLRDARVFIFVFREKENEIYLKVIRNCFNNYSVFFSVQKISITFSRFWIVAA